MPEDSSLEKDEVQQENEIIVLDVWVGEFVALCLRFERSDRVKFEKSVSTYTLLYSQIIRRLIHGIEIRRWIGA